MKKQMIKSVLCLICMFALCGCEKESLQVHQLDDFSSTPQYQRLDDATKALFQDDRAGVPFAYEGTGWKGATLEANLYEDGKKASYACTGHVETRGYNVPISNSL